jgi:NitT/TauT family transport system substrate-binding protein
MPERINNGRKAIMKITSMKGGAAAFLLATSTVCAGVSGASAEVSQIRIAQQYGLGFLPLMVMKDKGLFKKHAQEEHLNTTAEWLTLGGPTSANNP